jgi:hypothetical protein
VNIENYVTHVMIPGERERKERKRWGPGSGPGVFGKSF